MTQPLLHISFHGRVIEHLGIDMYQSPVAAVAELISNAWDADAQDVAVTLPKGTERSSTLVVADNGNGMTLEECQHQFLKVGYNRRAKRGEETKAGRKVMGRKGIGKFAGFGIAASIVVDTVSGETGERTVFELDLDRMLDAGDEDPTHPIEPLEVRVREYEPPLSSRKGKHGTTLTLTNLTLGKAINGDQFRTSMARRFVFLEKVAGFKVSIDGKPLPDTDALNVEFEFPRDFTADEVPDGVTVDGDWATEDVDGSPVRWRIGFYEQPISDEDLAGVAIYSHGKLAQRPFFFNLSGGFGGQQGIHYLSGQMVADFIDEQPRDLISTERQRVNWQDPLTSSLQMRGQEIVKDLLRIWQTRRAAGKVEAMEKKLARYSDRLEKLDRHEQKIVKRALMSMARIAVISDDQFADLANAILTAWEGGRLKELISDLAEADNLQSDALVSMLAESQVITALHAAEKVKAQLNLILGLSERIQLRQLENAIRDYIAENPWLISPAWETFKVEKGVNHLIESSAQAAKLTGNDWRGRVDLTLASGDHLLVLEFMKPGLKADWDHVSRFERYVRILREKMIGTRFARVSGLMVADRFEESPENASKISDLRRDGMDIRDWESLLADAKQQWVDYFDILVERAPGDERMLALATATRSIESAKKAASKKRQTKKTPAKKTAAKSSPTKKAPVKKTAAKKAAAKS